MSTKELTRKISNIEKMLAEIIIWLRIGNLEQLREILLRELNSVEKVRIFELTDGTRSQRDIAMRTKVSRSTIAYYWQKWQGLGILIHSKARKGRMKKIMSLDEIGITQPRIEKESKEIEIIFRSEDLSKILTDRKMFANTFDLASFAANILPDLPEVSYLARTFSREDLVRYIIETFRNSDRMKQALFMQALERRAHEKKKTQFETFFESWEKHIGR